MAHKISLAAVKAALASSKTPASLKRGLIKKYGHLLSGKLPMSALATTMQSNPKRKPKKSKGNITGTLKGKKPPRTGLAYTERQADSIQDMDLGYMGHPDAREELTRRELMGTNPAKKRRQKQVSYKKGVGSFEGYRLKIDKHTGQIISMKKEQNKNPAKKKGSFPKNHTHTQRFNNVAQYWDKASWQDRNALVMMADITKHYKGYYNLQDSFIDLPQAMRGALIIHLYKLK